MSELLVSIIVPVHDGERFLPATIESLLAQTYPRVEIIAVDDGSTDSSRAVLDRYPDVTVIEQPNAGVAAARNTGVATANGDLLAFCDQDDLHLPDKTECQVDHLAANPGLGLVLARQEIVLDEGVERPRWLVADPIYGDLGGVLPMCLMARRNVFDRVGGFDPAMSGSDDFDWLLRARAVGIDYEILDRVLVARRIHATNQSHDHDRLRSGTIRSVHNLLRAKRAASMSSDIDVSTGPSPSPGAGEGNEP